MIDFAIGLVTTAANLPARTSSTARSIAARASGALVASGLPGAASDEIPTGSTGSDVAKRAAACAASLSVSFTSRPSSRARAASSLGSPTSRKGGTPRASRSAHSASARSGPTPAGSPSVSASGKVTARGSAVFRYSMIERLRNLSSNSLSPSWIALAQKLFAHLAARRNVGDRLFTVADGDNFDAARDRLRRRERADRRLVEQLAQARIEVVESRTTGSFTTTSRCWRAIANPSWQLVNVLRNASASRTRVARDRIARSARHDENDLAKRVLGSADLRGLAARHEKRRRCRRRAP